MEVLSDNSLLHRDLKPDNILLDRPSWDSTVKITDFGLSRKIGNDQDLDLSYGVGTPLF